MIEQEVESRRGYPHRADDEISLIDMARVLLRRKRWVIGTFLVFLFSSLLFALVKERQYAYTTSILIGEFGLDKYVASATGVKSVLDSRIVPVVEREFVDARGIDAIPFRTVVNADEGNSFVNLRSDASEEEQELVKEFHNAMAEALTSDHRDKLSLLERESSIQLENLKESLATQQQQLRGLETLMTQLGNTGKELDEEGELTASAQSTPDGMEARLSTSSTALTMILSQLQLSEQLAERESRINELEGMIGQEELKRSWIKPTRVVSLAVSSIQPSGTSKGFIVALGGVLGLLLGVLMAFLADFVARIREWS